MIDIYIASDHAGIDLKKKLTSYLQDPTWLCQINRKIYDLGPQSKDSVDYPDFADLVCRKIPAAPNPKTFTPRLEVMGILICGSGQGMAMRANKFLHIRAALCDSKEISRLSREHNDANVLCLGARFVDVQLASEILRSFLTTDFGGGRHAKRVSKLNLPI